MRPVVDELEADGLVRRVAVDDGGRPWSFRPAPSSTGGPRGGVLLCPFDNLLWDRAFVERIFGFRHVIEVYKREHERVYGYYVLPFLYSRPAGRPRRPEGRPGRGRAASARLPPRAEGAPLGRARVGARAGARPAGAVLGLERVER